MRTIIAAVACIGLAGLGIWSSASAQEDAPEPLVLPAAPEIENNVPPDAEYLEFNGGEGFSPDDGGDPDPTLTFDAEPGMEEGPSAADQAPPPDAEAEPTGMLDPEAESPATVDMPPPLVDETLRGEEIAEQPSGMPAPDAEIPESTDAADGPETPPAPSPFFSFGLETLEATRAAPLFTPSRTPPVVAPEPEPEPPPEPEVVATESGPPQIKLIGITRVGAVEVVIVSDQATGEVKRINPGEDYEGWTLKILDGQSVELTSGEDSHTLTMFTEFPATGQPPTPSEFEDEYSDDFTQEEQMLRRRPGPRNVQIPQQSQDEEFLEPE